MFVVNIIKYTGMILFILDFSENRIKELPKAFVVFNVLGDGAEISDLLRHVKNFSHTFDNVFYERGMLVASKEYRSDKKKRLWTCGSS